MLEGAHTGLGLGHEFLRHIQRCRSLVHVIDGTSRDPIGDYAAVQNELLLFNPELADKPQVPALPCLRDFLLHAKDASSYQNKPTYKAPSSQDSLMSSAFKPVACFAVQRTRGRGDALQSSLIPASSHPSIHVLCIVTSCTGLSYRVKKCSVLCCVCFLYLA